MIPSASAIVKLTIDSPASSWFSSPAVEFTVVPLIDKPSVSSEPSISTFPDMSKVAAVRVHVNVGLAVGANVLRTDVEFRNVVRFDIVISLRADAEAS